MNPPTPPRPWRVVAEEVSRERDVTRMAHLLEELLRALEHEHNPQNSRLPERRELSKPPDLRRLA